MNEAVMHAILMQLELQGQLVTEGLKVGEMKGLMHQMEDGSRIFVRVRWAPPPTKEEDEN